MITIESNGIGFIPLFWDFISDGVWGDVHFLVPKNTFEPGTNNGAHAASGVPEPIINFMEYLPLIDSGWDNYQLVYAAIPCITIGEDGYGHECAIYKFGEILQASADFICENLKTQ